jgi:hypothetical protein
MAEFTKVTVMLEGMSDDGRPFTNTITFIDPAKVEFKQNRGLMQVIEGGKVTGYIPSGQMTFELKVEKL